MHIVFSESWNYFYHFFRIFNLDIFRALILQICIWSIYLVSATPPTVFGESFWNFTVVFRMVWRYAYCFLRILKLFFLHFNLDIFSSLYATDMYREYMPCIGNPAYSFRPILLKLYRYFAAFLWFHMRNLSLAGYNCSGGASCMACSFIITWDGSKRLTIVNVTLCHDLRLKHCHPPFLRIVFRHVLTIVSQFNVVLTKTRCCLSFCG